VEGGGGEGVESGDEVLLDLGVEGLVAGELFDG
jgi:hypothetical protein